VTAEPWPVEFERRADKDLERLDAPVRQRVITAIERLANPHQGDQSEAVNTTPGSRAIP
jgi:mRNA-degrading endonuclease RelE of RelBE toxin-antitoxin system